MINIETNILFVILCHPLFLLFQYSFYFIICHIYQNKGKFREKYVLSFLFLLDCLHIYGNQLHVKHIKKQAVCEPALLINVLGILQGIAVGICLLGKASLLKFLRAAGSSVLRLQVLPRLPFALLNIM